MPLYHRSTQGLVCQQFLPPGSRSEALRIEGQELDIKRRMVGAYASQAGALESFNLEVERFRPSASYDFLRPPRAGVINYEVWQWPVNAALLCGAFAALLDGTGLAQVGSQIGEAAE